MADSVFVNKRSVIHKGSAARSTAFPCVNLCPPSPPSGPVPTPLPNLAQAADLAAGASSVTVQGNPVAKQSSHIARSTGNGMARSTGGGIVTHVVEGKAYFTSYSMDVTVEGEGVPRHLDMLTHNHASPPGNAVGTIMGTATVPTTPGRPAQSEPKPREPVKQAVEIFVDMPVEGHPGEISVALESRDKAYKHSLKLSGGASKTAKHYVLRFPDVLPGKAYQLYYVVGAQRVPLFTGWTGFADLRDHSPAGKLAAERDVLTELSCHHRQEPKAPPVSSKDDFMTYNPEHDPDNEAWYTPGDPMAAKKRD